MPKTTDPFAHAEATAHEWLAVLSAELGTGDRVLAHRVLRAWLHAVRDRLPVTSASNFAAQLPMLLRGEFFEGWAPSRVPVFYDVTEFSERFAAEAGIHQSQVADAAAAVTTALDGLCSPGQLDHALAPLPRTLQSVLAPPIRAQE